MKYIVPAATALFLTTGVTFADQKLDISKIVTKADAEAALGVPMKDAKGENKNGTDGFYDSEWSYYAANGDKALIFDFLIPGKEARPHLTLKMLSVMGPKGKKPASMSGLGDKAIFYHRETGLEMMNILKGEILITIETHGLPAEKALELEKSLAQKILAQS